LAADTTIATGLTAAEVLTIGYRDGYVPKLTTATLYGKAFALFTAGVSGALTSAGAVNRSTALLCPCEPSRSNDHRLSLILHGFVGRSYSAILGAGHIVMA
jgi:hypothetical protein